MDFPFGLLLGGIGLFLYGMMTLSDGLKEASWPFLVKFLEKMTDTRLKWFFSGVLATTILQSSTATTLLAIGFVNAGILSFTNSLWLIFGSNVGTTTTGWFVALIGLKMKIDIFALPMIGMGVLMTFLKSQTVKSVGKAISGFGMLFLGLSFLQESFANIKDIIDFTYFTGHGTWSLVAFVFAGIFLSVVMQSSTAATAVIFTLASTAGLPLMESAAGVIGANIGTTTTAFFATLHATANAKRAAYAHILFNVIAGVVAFSILPFFVRFLDLLTDVVHMDDSIATLLAVFHTGVNTLGALLMIPLAGPMGRFLSHRFTKDEEQVEKTKYLDDTLLEMPALAVEALFKEIDRYRDLLVSSTRGFLGSVMEKSSNIPRVSKIKFLWEKITEYIIKLTKSGMSASIAEDIRNSLQFRDEYNKSATALNLLASQVEEYQKAGIPIKKQLDHYLKECDELLEYIDTPIGTKPKGISETKLKTFETVYEKFKKNLLKYATISTISVNDLELLTELARTLRRMIHAFAKAQKINYK